MSKIDVVPAPVQSLEYSTGDVDRRYRYWRFRILLTSIIGYALFYFVRANDAVPVKAMISDPALHLDKTRIGLLSTIGGVTYGVSKFINGFLGDHANPRWFMAAGLFVCAVMNIFFGLSSTLVFFIGFWFANMLAQGMGFPPCAKSMAHWFSPKERNTTFGVWHTSHMIGGGLIMVLTGYLVKYVGWRSCYYVPAVIALVGVVIILIFMRDTPESLGLPPVELYKGEETPKELAEELKEPVPTIGPDRASGDYASPPEPATYWQVVNDYIFKNPFMWIISIANGTTYLLRWVQMKWGPTFLQEAKGISVVNSAWLGFGSEMAGMISALIGGYIADKYFRGRAGRVCTIAMLLMTGVIWLFWNTPKGDPWTASALFILMGFLLYVPQMLIAAMAMSLGTKRASAAAVGMTGLFGYIATVPAGWGVGYLADKGLRLFGHQLIAPGWSGPFALLLGCAIATLILMATTWNVGAHPHPHGEIVSEESKP
jgi:OPA family glycerol-3-phosphate transporter-like MFS transporter/OPA family sugar phosphate sensor protein UhpC-like MFS transporter